MSLRNNEHYVDLTAYKALRKVNRDDDKEDAKRMEDALRKARAIFYEAGFEVAERIVLKNVRTGKVYR